MSEPNDPVLRVTQLDTNELNESFLLTLKHSLNEDALKYIKIKYVQRYHVEIFAGLKFILWYYTYGKSGQTVGQSIFDWSYVFDSNNSKRLILFKKMIHAVVYCLDEWIEQNLHRLLKKLITYIIRKKNGVNSERQGPSELEKKFNSIYNFSYCVYKMVSLVNYVMFLFNGTYLHLWERLLKMRPVFKQPQMMAQLSASTEASVREELWQSYFTLFRLSSSLFDFKKFYEEKMKKKSPFLSTDDVKSNELDISICDICLKDPINVHRAVDVFDTCKHVFCYFCIKSELLKSPDNNYSCKSCSKSFNKIELYMKS